MEEENSMKLSQPQLTNPMIENHSVPMVPQSLTQQKRRISTWLRVVFCLMILVVIGTTLDALVAYINGYTNGIIHDTNIDFTNSESSNGEIHFTFTLDSTSWFQSHLHTLHVDGMECDLSMKIPKVDYHRNMNSDYDHNEIIEYYEETHVAHLSLLQSLVLHPRPLWFDIVNSADEKKKNHQPDDAAQVITERTTTHYLRGSLHQNTESSASTTASSPQHVLDNHKVTTKVGISHVQFSSLATLLATLTTDTQKIYLSSSSGRSSSPIGMAQCVLNGWVDVYSMGHWGLSLQDYSFAQQHSVNLTHYINNDLHNHGIPIKSNNNNNITSSSSSRDSMVWSKSKDSPTSYQAMLDSLVHTLLTATKAQQVTTTTTTTTTTTLSTTSDMSINVQSSSSNPTVNGYPLSTINHAVPIPINPRSSISTGAGAGGGSGSGLKYQPIISLTDNDLAAEPTIQPTFLPSSRPTMEPTFK